MSNRSNEWYIEVDNAFAKGVLSSIKSKGLRMASASPSSNLCRTCKEMRDNVWSTAFQITYTLQQMNTNCALRSCDLCRLLWETCQNHNVVNRSAVIFERIDSSIRMNSGGPVILSLQRSPDLETRISNEIQVGYPGLVTANSEAHFEIMRHWLELCDNTHQGCFSGQDSTLRSLPTRVIAVGKQGDSHVRLVETRHGAYGEWIALSHQWGSGNRVCTTTENKHTFLDGVEYASLPGTFKDAVDVTRALGKPYLWIDSLCIVQEGAEKDFNEESKRMEHVYSGAYCVIGASRSPGHFAGFLGNRNQRNTVVLQGAGDTAPFYISQSIDDFNFDVLEGSLNKRGWVLQEHALARRTIYFTAKQTYFECGDGVRCETMTKMRNERAAFLGDSIFPKVIMRAEPGERVLRYQHLYRTYSRLGLSNVHDRPLAINGLQSRILKALGVKGGYGIFDEGAKDNRGRGLLRRSLLWRRGLETARLVRIDFPNNRLTASVPSWSWMSVQGGIDYISPPFGDIRWEALESPWSFGVGRLDGGIRTDSESGSFSLVAEARNYDLPSPGNTQGEVVFDCPGQSHQLETKCVILGKQKRNVGLLSDGMKIHYVLVIASKNNKDPDGRSIYERVGAGSLPGRCIKTESDEVRIY